MAGGLGVDGENSFFDPDQKTIINWANSLSEDELKVVKLPLDKKIGRLEPKDFLKQLDSYQTGKNDKKYGLLPLGSRNSGIPPYICDRSSSYYNNPAMVKRIWLHVAMKNIKRFDPSFCFFRIRLSQNIQLR